jgi:ABC-type glutathione transport system ATPase component
VLSPTRELHQGRRLALLLISHHPGVAAELAQRTAVMFESRFAEFEPTSDAAGAPGHARAGPDGRLARSQSTAEGLQFGRQRVRQYGKRRGFRSPRIGPIGAPTMTVRG